MPRNIGSQNTPRSIVNGLIRDAVASGKCGYSIHRHPRKAPPLTATLFEHLIAQEGPIAAGFITMAALNKAAPALHRAA